MGKQWGLCISLGETRSKAAPSSAASCYLLCVGCAPSPPATHLFPGPAQCCLRGYMAGNTGGQSFL